MIDRRTILDELDVTAVEQLDFEDTLVEVGQWDVGAYVYFPEMRRRFAQRRAQWLETEYSIPHRWALAIAGREANVDMGWVADELDVQRSTIERYYDDVQEELGYYVLTGRLAPGRIDEPLDVSGPTENPAKCPECGTEKVMSVECIPSTFPQMTEGLSQAIDEAQRKGMTHVCTYAGNDDTPACHAKFARDTDTSGDEADVMGQFKNIPKNVTQYDRWLCHEDKITKAPWVAGRADGGLKGGAMNANGWTDFNNAADWAHKLNMGLQFALTDQDDICVIDLDDVIGEDGQIDDIAADIIDEFNTYTEISPSGNGVHIVMLANIPEDRAFRGSIEVYDSGRAITFTGNVLRDQPVVSRYTQMNSFAEEYAVEIDPAEEYDVRMPADGEGPDNCLANLRVIDLYPGLAGYSEAERAPHPIHGSGTGGNTGVMGEGAVCYCFRCDEAVNAAHLLVMEAWDIDECGTAKALYRKDDEAVLDTYVHAVHMDTPDVDPDEVPYRALCEAARKAGFDPEADDASDRANAFDTGRLVLREHYDVPISKEYNPDD